MDLQQLRGWADVMDKALVISTVVAVLGIAAVGVSAFFSVRFAGAIRAQEAATFDRYRAEWGRHAAQLEAEASKAAERAAVLEKAAAEAQRRLSEVDGDKGRAAERAAALEREAAEARQQVVELQRRLAERQVATAPPPPPVTAAPQVAASPAAPPAVPAAAAPGLARFAGTRAAIYIVDEVPDGTPVGAAVDQMLGEAGWAPLTWRWTGVGGIVGTVVLIREGSDAATEAAAQGLLEALQAAGFNVAKGHWPADWRRFKGTLHGPQTPAATDAPIRIVIGAKAR
ncbi:MAG: hypothetical protein LCH95_09600 [Proteobacteria bacterium]|nr:hypothetical protein [Pseudomonadota bacterium]